VVVIIVIVAVLVVLVAVMRWADRRDRAKGHINRGVGDMKSAIRKGKEHKIALQLRDRPRPRRLPKD
jgi:FtsZ-interacting cell division protein ZipA